MVEYQERDAPASGIARLLRTTHPAEALVMLVVLPLAGLALIQFMAQLIVVTVLQGAFAPSPILQYVGQWFTSRPAAAYGVPSGNALHWVIAAAFLTTALTVTVFVIRARRKVAKDPQRRPGLADRSDVRAQLGTSQLVNERGPHLRPSLASSTIEPRDVGYHIGTYRGDDIWLRAEDPTILVGPSRSGKGFRFILRWILTAPGAVITTSSKLDNAKITMLQRKRQGSPVLIFAPGIDGGERLGHVMRWSPVDGCVEENVLSRRMSALIPADSFSGSTSNGGHWDTLGRQLASHLFHAAACGGLTVDAVWDWVSSPTRAQRAVELIREHPEGLEEHAAHLESVLGQPAEQRATSWGVLPTVLAFMDSRAAREWMKPAPGEEVDLVDFILRKGTMYMVGDKMVSQTYVRIIEGLLAEFDYVTKELASASPGDRLDPPVTYLLDEAGNFNYPGMYEGITAGGGRGRVVVPVFQSKSQLDQYGGADTAATLWDAAVAKVILPGGGDPKTLGEFSDLIGQTWVERESVTVGTGPASRQLSAEKRDILTKEDIRTMDAKYALVFYRNLKPVIAETVLFSGNPHFDACVRDAEALDVEARKDSAFAAAIANHRGQ